MAFSIYVCHNMKETRFTKWCPEDLLLVIHVMNLREKFRGSYEQGRREE